MLFFGIFGICIFPSIPPSNYDTLTYFLYGSVLEEINQWLYFGSR